MTIELAQWRLFRAAAERGSLVQAADLLHTDQPALSRSLRRLERLVGAPLFERSSRGLTLTDLGRSLLPEVIALLDHADAVERHACAGGRRVSGVLRVGSVDMYPINAAIAAASQDLVVDGVEVHVDVVALPWLAHDRALRDRTIDVGFTLTVDGRLAEPAVMRSSPLYDETTAYALVSDQHPLAAAARIHPTELADLPLHLPSREHNPDVHDLTLELLADNGLPAPRRAADLGSLANVIAHTAAGDGWMLTTSTLARHAPSGIVARPLEVTTRRAVRFEAIWHVNTDAPTVSAFTRRFEAALEDRR